MPKRRRVASASWMKWSPVAHSAGTAANLHELNTTTARLHGDECLIYGVAAGFCEAVAGPIGMEKRGDVQNCEAEFRVVIKPGQRRVLPETPEGRMWNLIETAKAHFRAKVNHPFRIINDQFGFRKVFYRGIRLPSPEGERDGATRTISN